ncbi:MAG: alpha-E domain-containing protein [Planctomycetota bacterium]|nr:alpha-E domain-containing protein [Planctomycetota bacterium]
MLSRVADSIYWMSRYIERAENVARFVEVNLQLRLDTPADSAGQWEPLVTTSGDEAIYTELYGKPTSENVVEFLTFDRRYGSSVLSCVMAARENARCIRDVISSDMWEQINRFYLFMRDPASRQAANDNPHDFYASIRMASHLVAGITDATMAHNEAWHFARMGRLTERADKTSRILDVKYFILLPRVDDVGTPVDTIHWSALLKSASALEMYRKRFPTIDPEAVAEFLILDREFPRAIRYCVARAEESMRAITGSAPGTFYNHADQLLGRLRSELDYARIAEVISVGLHEYLDGLQGKLNAIDAAVGQTFFGIAPPAPAKKAAEPAARPRAMEMASA